MTIKKFTTLLKILKNNDSFIDLVKIENNGMLLVDTITNRQNWVYYTDKKLKIYVNTHENDLIRLYFTSAKSMADFIINNGLYRI